MSSFWAVWEQFWGIAGPIASVWSAVGTWYSIAAYRMARQERARRQEAEGHAAKQAELAAVRGAAYEALGAWAVAQRLLEAAREEKPNLAQALELAGQLRRHMQEAREALPERRPIGLAYRLARFAGEWDTLQRTLLVRRTAPVEAVEAWELLPLTTALANITMDIAVLLKHWGEREAG